MGSILLDDSEYEKILRWESEKDDSPHDSAVIPIGEFGDEEFDDGLKDEDIGVVFVSPDGKMSIGDAPDEITKKNKRLANHPAFDIPFPLVRLNLFEVRERNPEAFMHIFGLMESILNNNNE